LREFVVEFVVEFVTEEEEEDAALVVLGVAPLMIK
jgi:hypothetical protein